MESRYGVARFLPLLILVLLGVLPITVRGAAWAGAVPIPDVPSSMTPSAVALDGAEIRISWGPGSWSMQNFGRTFGSSSDRGATFTTLSMPSQVASTMTNSYVAPRPQGGFTYVWHEFTPQGDSFLRSAVETPPGNIILSSDLPSLVGDNGESLSVWGLTPGTGGQILALVRGLQSTGIWGEDFTLLGASLSSDGGSTWGAAPSIDGNVSEVVSDFGAGRFIALYTRAPSRVEDTSEVFLAVSETGSASTWRSSRVATASLVGNPALAVASNGTLILAWLEVEQFPSTTFSWHWRFSPPPYEDFSASGLIPFLAGQSVPQKLGMIIGGAGEIHAAWTTADSPSAGGTSVKYARSSETWEWLETPETLGEGEIPGLALGMGPYGTVFVSWAQGPGTTWQAFLRRSAFPGITVTGDPAGQVLSEPFVLRGTVESGSVAQVRIDSGEWTNATGGPAWAFTVDPSKMAVGEHTLAVRACRTNFDECSSPRESAFKTSSAPVAVVSIAIAIVATAALLVVAFWYSRRSGRQRGETRGP